MPTLLINISCLENLWSFAWPSSRFVFFVFFYLFIIFLFVELVVVAFWWAYILDKENVWDRVIFILNVSAHGQRPRLRSLVGWPRLREGGETEDANNNSYKSVLKTSYVGGGESRTTIVKLQPMMSTCVVWTKRRPISRMCMCVCAVRAGLKMEYGRLARIVV